MRRALAGILCSCALGAVASQAQDSVPAETLRHLKSATVFITVEIGGDKRSGSGFLFERQGDAGYIVTNAHVVAVDVPVARLIQVIFDGATPDERSAPATRGGEKLREYGVLQEKPVIEHLLPLPRGRALLLNTSRGGLLVELPE